MRLLVLYGNCFANIGEICCLWAAFWPSLNSKIIDVSQRTCCYCFLGISLFARFDMSLKTFVLYRLFGERFSWPGRKFLFGATADCEAKRILFGGMGGGDGVNA